MNPDILAVLCRERRRSVREDFARSEAFSATVRCLTARTLRASGESLFRLGVSLDERVLAPSTAETHVS